MVANLKGKPSHEIVRDANTMLVRMAHRGGCGCEPNSGDGAGILTGMPDGFLRRAVREDLGVDLPAAGTFGAGNVFFPRDKAAVAECKRLVEGVVAAHSGLELIGWRPVPVDNSALGPTSLESEPVSEQLLVAAKGGMGGPQLNRELWRLRIAAEKAVHAEPSFDDFYVCSLTNSTLVYKGQLTPEQVWGYFEDLQQPDYASHLALVHSRFSTNTFPSWARAQPFRSLCHNGEINTLRGNKNMMTSREAALASPHFDAATLSATYPITGDHMSDSGNFDAVAELLMHGGERQIHEAVMMMVPEAWQKNPRLSEERRAFYEYHAALMEPWDGPAMMSFTDGRYVGACSTATASAPRATTSPPTTASSSRARCALFPRRAPPPPSPVAPPPPLTPSPPPLRWACSPTSPRTSSRGRRGSSPAACSSSTLARGGSSRTTSSRTAWRRRSRTPSGWPTSPAASTRGSHSRARRRRRTRRAPSSTSTCRCTASRRRRPTSSSRRWRRGRRRSARWASTRRWPSSRASRARHPTTSSSSSRR